MSSGPIQGSLLAPDRALDDSHIILEIRVVNPYPQQRTTRSTRYGDHIGFAHDHVLLRRDIDDRGAAGASVVRADAADYRVVTQRADLSKRQACTPSGIACSHANPRHFLTDLAIREGDFYRATYPQADTAAAAVCAP